MVDFILSRGITRVSGIYIIIYIGKCLTRTVAPNGTIFNMEHPWDKAIQMFK